MGRPKELSEEERQELLAKGYKPVEVWVNPIAERGSLTTSMK